jgi:hypothetical protein
LGTDFFGRDENVDPLELGLNGIFLGLNKIDFLGLFGLKWDVSFCEKNGLQIVIRIDVRMERISRMRYGFFLFFTQNKALGLKKNPYESVKSVKSVHLFVSQPNPIGSKKLNFTLLRQPLWKKLSSKMPRKQ